MLRALRRAVAAAVLALGLVATAPAGAQSWSEPELVAPTSADRALQLATHANGRATALIGSTLATRPPDGGWTSRAGAVALDTPVLSVYGDDRVAVVGSVERPPALRAAPQALFGRADGTFSRARTLNSRGVAAFTPQTAAANASGDVVLAWVAAPDSRLRVAIRPRRGAMTPSVRGPAGGGPMAAAINARGDAVVVFGESDRLWIALRRAGRRFGRAFVLAREYGRSTSVTIDDKGRILVAWFAQFARSQFTGGTVSRTAYVIGSIRGEFGAPVVLEEGDAPAAGLGARAAFEPSGHGLVAWTGRDDGVYRVRVARVTRGAPPVVQTLSAPGEHSMFDDDLAVGPTGAAVVAWQAGDPAAAEGDRVLASYRPGSTDPFGAPEQVSPPGDLASFPEAAVDPRSGAPLVLWTRRDGGTGARTTAAAVGR